MRSEGLWHIFEQIFGYLNYETVEICREVSEFWNESLQRIGLVKFLEEFGDRNVEYPKTNTKVSTYKEYILGWKMASQRYGAKATIEDLEELKDSLEERLSEDCWGCPVHRAAKNGAVKLLDFLLSTSYDVNSRDFIGFTVFHEACYSGRIECAKLLIELSTKNNLDLNSRDNDGHTAFTRACQFGKTETVKLLVELSTQYGIDLDGGRDDSGRPLSGRTPYLWACKNGHEETVGKLLVELSTKYSIDIHIDLETNDSDE